MKRGVKVANEKLVKYEDVRNQIQNGDIFLFRGQFLISKIFRRVDKSYYSHAAMAAWWHDRLIIMQAEGPGIQAIPMSVAVGTYPGKVDWHPLKREEIPEIDTKLHGVLREAKSDLGLKYGFGDLWKNIMHWFANVKLKDPVRPHAMFCSEYVERCFRIGGIALTDRPDIATMPKHIAASKLIEYEATIPHDPKLYQKRDIDDVRAMARTAHQAAS